jgi:hypothetical protein
MQDHEFTALSRDEAWDYAIVQSELERARLFTLYRSARGVNIFGSDGPKVDSSVAQPAAPESLMLIVGRVGFCLSVLGMALILLLSSQGEATTTHWLLLMFLASIVGLFAFMWMMGALEKRLIEIATEIRSLPHS